MKELKLLSQHLPVIILQEVLYKDGATPVYVGMP